MSPPAFTMAAIARRLLSVEHASISADMPLSSWAFTFAPARRRVPTARASLFHAAAIIKGVVPVALRESTSPPALTSTLMTPCAPACGRRQRREAVCIAGIRVRTFSDRVLNHPGGLAADQVEEVGRALHRNLLPECRSSREIRLVRLTNHDKAPRRRTRSGDHAGRLQPGESGARFRAARLGIAALLATFGSLAWGSGRCGQRYRPAIWHRPWHLLRALP